MTADSMPARNDPRRLLADSRHLAHRVRLAQRVTWFPLLVLAVVTFGGAPVYRYGPRDVSCHAVGVGTVCRVWLEGAVVYWPLALVLAYTVIAGGYLLVARARGLGSRVRPYALTGVGLAALLVAVSVWTRLHVPPAYVNPDVGVVRVYPAWVVPLVQLVEPPGAIGVALLVLAWLERHVALLLFTVGYLVVALVPVNFGWGTHWGLETRLVPQSVIDGGVLLLGAVGFALARRWYR